uniref:Uncharacterized protein n=1 Tax=Arundo donax TaxID=35708 RepID=A0A0A8Z8R7_ARUDO
MRRNKWIRTVSDPIVSLDIRCTHMLASAHKHRTVCEAWFSAHVLVS